MLRERSDFFSLESMATRISDLTTMRQFLAIPHVDMDAPASWSIGAVTFVSWYETHGGVDVLKWERWRKAAPDIFLVTSQKK